MQASDTTNLLTGILTLKTREEYHASSRFFDSPYDLYEFNQWHRYMTQIVQAVQERNESNSLNLTPDKKDALLNFIKSAHVLLHTFSNLKSYESEHSFLTFWGSCENDCNQASMKNPILPTLTELLKAMHKVLKPGQLTDEEYKRNLWELQHQTTLLSKELTPSIGKKICQALAVFFGAAFIVAGTYLALIATGPAASAISGFGGFSAVVGSIIAVSSSRFFMTNYPKKITEFAKEIGKPITQKVIKDVFAARCP